MPEIAGVDNIFPLAWECTSLLAGLQAQDAYALQCRPSFSGQSLIRAAKTGDKIILDGYIGGESHFSSRRVLKELSLSEWEELLQAVEHADLWNIPEFVDDFGLDGTTWTIEGRKNDCRRRISRWCPNELVITDLGAVFFRLAGDGKAIALAIE